MFKIVKAEAFMIDEIDDMYKKCIKDMDEKNIHQWDYNVYPNRRNFEDGVKQGDLYCAVDNGKVVGTVILNSFQSPEYKDIPWTEKEGGFLIIHTLAVHPDHQGMGYAGKLVKFAEEYAAANGFVGIRLDAFSENEAALKLYEKRGYVYKGKVYFAIKKVPYNWYNCYEKIF